MDTVSLVALWFVNGCLVGMACFIMPMMFG